MATRNIVQHPNSQNTRGNLKLIPSQKSPANSSRVSPIRLAKSGNSAAPSRTQMTFLRAALPPGALHIFHAQRYGNGVGFSTACPFCDKKPPQDVKMTGARRRWQAAHLAVVHVKGELPG